ncbi:hypothetical protein [Shouchella patagoniensis]|uniref:hypothetical protein n=1 Tax=Shouchella patagoniensis TaxID=228576 RepID=UPI000995D834|nr:hypothetical protein [Shouchella patagoniensis]
MEERAEEIIASIQAENDRLLEKWQTEGYIPMETGVLLYVKTTTGQPVVVSIQDGENDVYHIELLRNNDKFDRIVLDGKYDVPRERLASQIDAMLSILH